VEAENASNPRGEGLIDPNNFAPFSKNPTLAKFFAQLGRVDELGSGILNVNKYLKLYSGKTKPQFIEGSVFKTIIPIPEITAGVTGEGIKSKVEGLIEGITEGINKEMAKRIAIAVSNNPGIKIDGLLEKVDMPRSTLKKYLKTLIDEGFVVYKGSKKTGGYYPQPG
jgi:ATP-dependent DNA helicase RecG